MLYFIGVTELISRVLGVQDEAICSLRQKSRHLRSGPIKAAQLANEGHIDADLGGGVVKQRIARAGEGKSGGSRTILVFRREDRAIYVYGLEKKDQANIDRRELEALKELAVVLLSYTEIEIERQVTNGALIRVESPQASNIQQAPQ